MSGLGNKDIMARNIQYYMDKYEKTRQDMCNALGVKYTTFTDWVKGNSYPRIDKIELWPTTLAFQKLIWSKIMMNILVNLQPQNQI